MSDPAPTAPTSDTTLPGAAPDGPGRAGDAPERRGDYVDSSRRGFDPALRPYRVAVYVSFAVILLWFCLGMIVSVVRYLF